MKMRLIYFLTTILMGIGIIFLYAKVDQLEGINSDWSATYQLQTDTLWVEIFKLNDDIRQWHEAVESRDVTIEYYKTNYEGFKSAYWRLLENPVEVEVPIEAIKYRNIFPREFESVEQFEEWYWEQISAIKLNYKCVDYAKWLQRTALTQGYSVSQALVWWGRYYSVKVSDDVRCHAGNLALIADTYYYVEPHPKWFKVIKII